MLGFSDLPNKNALPVAEIEDIKRDGADRESIARAKVIDDALQSRVRPHAHDDHVDLATVIRGRVEHGRDAWMIDGARIGASR